MAARVEESVATDKRFCHLLSFDYEVGAVDTGAFPEDVAIDFFSRFPEGKVSEAFFLVLVRFSSGCRYSGDFDPAQAETLAADAQTTGLYLSNETAEGATGNGEHLSGRISTGR